MTHQLVLDKPPALDEDDEPIKASKWVRLVFLSDGRTCFNRGVFDTEEEAAKDVVAISGPDQGQRLVDCHPNSLWRGWTKPNMQGEQVFFLAAEYTHHIPYPLI